MNIRDYLNDPNAIIKKCKAFKTQLLDDSDIHWTPVKIALLSGSTIGIIKDVLELFLLNYGIFPEFFEGTYNRFYEDAVFENNELERFAPEIIYIHTSSRNILNFPEYNDSLANIKRKSDAACTYFKTVWDSLSAKYSCPIIQNNFEMLPYRILGNQDICNIHGRLNFINTLNARFYSYAQENSSFFINDINFISAKFGLDKWDNPTNWYMYKYMLDLSAVPCLCDNLSKIIKSLLGKNKKVLVLDLDNTIWGGNIGDLGKENILIGKNSPKGEAYSDFQSYIKSLLGIGVSLAISSKNEAENTIAGFENANNLLKFDDFISTRINWCPKSENIKEIADEINLLLESMVFADDNPAEIHEVQSQLQGISVLELKSPETHINALDCAGFFEATVLSADDSNRNSYYKQNHARMENQASFKSYDDYLHSLKMQVIISEFNNEDKDRIIQLIDKTNQFNTTGTRVTPQSFDEILDCCSYIVLSAKLSDKFGDNGLVSAIIAKIEFDNAMIMNWVMSCRVFKRNLEFAIFDSFVENCKEKNITSITGIVKHTTKNAYINSLYPELGFIKINDGLYNYEIPEVYIKKNKIIEVRKNG